MTDRPILFSAPMVRALIDGRKTQTRRNFPQPFQSGYFQGGVLLDVIKASSRAPKAFRFSADAVGGGAVLNEVFEPKINEGDRLWVREAFRGGPGYDKLPPREWSHWPVHYEADGAPDPREEMDENGRLRPGIHMPRWASRITLKVTDVRVERLRSIREADAIAEGAELDPISSSMVRGGPMVRVGPGVYLSPVAWYHRLWDEINGAGAWDANPWVAVYDFKVFRSNIDSLEGLDERAG